MSILKQTLIDTRDEIQSLLDDSVGMGSLGVKDLQLRIRNINRMITRMERFEKTVHGIKNKIKSKQK